MASDFTVRAGDVTYRIQGLSKTVRALEAAGVAAGQMSGLMHEVGEVVAVTARSLAPVKSGRLAGTVRAGKGRTKAVIYAGGRGLKYAGVTHYGWPARNISAQPFLLDALRARQGAAISTLARGLDDLLKDNHLK